MRANFPKGGQLEQWCRRTDPLARLILEAGAVAGSGAQADIRQRQSQWGAADSLTNLTNPADGTLRLNPGNVVLIQSTTRDTYFISLDSRPGTVSGAEVTFGGTQPYAIEIANIQAYLDPANSTSPNTGVQTVVYWEMHLYSVEDAGNLQGFASGSLLLNEIAQPLRVVAQTSAGLVTFDYSTRFGRPQPIAGGGQGNILPVILIEIRGLLADGTAATNIGWAIDDTVPSITASGVVLKGMTYTAKRTPSASGTQTWNRADQAKTPYVIVNLVNYPATATVAFTGSNKITLPNTPTNVVEFVCQGSTPGGSTLQFQAKVNPGDSWVTVKDGSTIGANNPATDVALAKSATYLMQCILSSDSGNLVGPVVNMMGVREVTLTSFDGLLAPPRCNWSLDPITLKAEIAAAEFEVLKDGETDYNSAIETLLANNDIGSIDLRLWVGHPDLSRDQWMLVDIFQIDDPESRRGASLVLMAISPLQQLRQILPVYNTAANTRTVLTYTNKSLQFVYDDLINGQLGLPGRFYGPRVEDTSTLVTKSIGGGNTVSDAKKEADAIAYLAGGSIIPSQGRLKWVRIINDPAQTGQGTAVRAIIPREEIKFGVVTPGFRLRQPEWFVASGYDFFKQQYTGPEARGFHAAALTKLGAARIDATQRPDDVITQWIPASTILTVTGITRSGQVATATTAASHGYSAGQVVTIAGANQTQYNGTFPIIAVTATTFTYIVTGSPTTPATGVITVTSGLAQNIANRQTQYFGTGMVTLSFETEYAFPELELGDVIAVQTGRFVGRDPNSGTAVKGTVWAVGVIVGQHDALGRAFTLWVQNWADLLTGNIAATRLGFAYPEVTSLELYGDNTSGTVYANIKTRQAGSFKWAASTSGYPTAATIRAGSVQTMDSSGVCQAVTLSPTLTPGQTLYVGILAYEDTAGTVNETPVITQAQILRVPTATKTLRFSHADIRHDDDPGNSYAALTDDSSLGYVYPATAPSVTAVGVLTLPIPIGVTITKVRVSWKTTTAGLHPDQVRAKLFRQPVSGGGAPTAITDTGLIQSQTFGNPSNEQLCSELTSGQSYYFWILLQVGNATPGSNVGFEWGEIVYTMPSYFQTY